MSDDEKLAQFGHHPDADIDAEVEIERLRGHLCDAHMGLIRALDYRAATPEGLSIKGDVRAVLANSGYEGDLGYRENF